MPRRTARLLVLAALLLPAGCGRTPSSEASSISRTTTVTLRDGDLLVNGRAYFPVGFYHDSDTPAPGVRTAGELVRDRASGLAALGAAGFNAFAPVPIRASALETEGANWRAPGLPFAALLDEADRDDTLVLVQGLDGESNFGRHLGRGRAFVDALARHPATLAFALADDADDQPYLSPGAIRDLGRLARERAPDKLTFMTVTANLAWMRANAGGDGLFRAADIVGVQWYPVCAEPLGGFHVLREANALAEEGGQALVAVLQAFAGPDRGACAEPRLPTPEEAVNMTYAALAAGVKGLLYYSLRGADGDLRARPGGEALWAALGSLRSDAAALAPLLSGGRSRVLNEFDPTVVEWTVSGRRLVFALNFTGSYQANLAGEARNPGVTQRATLRLDRDAGAPRPVPGVSSVTAPCAGMTVAGTALSVAVPALGVRVCELPRTSAAQGLR